MEQLPEYMKICYMALYNTTHEIAYRIQKEHRLTVVAYLKRTVRIRPSLKTETYKKLWPRVCERLIREWCLILQWIDLSEAYLEEAKWLNSGYMPTFREYLDNGVISSGSYMALVHATFLVGDGLSKEAISMMMPYPKLLSCSAEILRLWDDLGTSRVSHYIPNS